MEKKARKVRTPFKDDFCLNRGEIVIKTRLNAKLIELMKAGNHESFKKSTVGTQKLMIE